LEVVDYDAPIETLEQAEAYFKGLGCNHFHLSREHFVRYDEYKALRVSKAIEESWRVEEFDRALSILMDKTSTREVWSRHSSLHSLYRGFGDEKLRRSAFDKVVAATFEIARMAPRFDRLLISETILGRSTYRENGMVTEARVLGLPETVDALLELVRQLLDFEAGDPDLEERRKDAAKLRQQMHDTPELFALPKWIEARVRP
jgi:hypothetical protein